jgi:hypothetical protein
MLIYDFIKLLAVLFGIQQGQTECQIGDKAKFRLSFIGTGDIRCDKSIEPSQFVPVRPFPITNARLSPSVVPTPGLSGSDLILGCGWRPVAVEVVVLFLGVILVCWFSFGSDLARGPTARKFKQTNNTTRKRHTLKTEIDSFPFVS